MSPANVNQLNDAVTKLLPDKFEPDLVKITCLKRGILALVKTQDYFQKPNSK